MFLKIWDHLFGAHVDSTDENTSAYGTAVNLLVNLKCAESKSSKLGD